MKNENIQPSQTMVDSIGIHCCSDTILKTFHCLWAIALNCKDKTYSVPKVALLVEFFHQIVVPAHDIFSRNCSFNYPSYQTNVHNVKRMSRLGDSLLYVLEPTLSILNHWEKIFNSEKIFLHIWPWDLSATNVKENH